MKHTKQSQLIQYQFKLLSGNKLQQVKDHLAACELCRKELERIRQKYAPLELLREEITATEALITQTVDNIGAGADGTKYKGMKPGESGLVIRKSYLFGPRGMWTAAAVVMFLFGGMFIIAQFLGDDPTTITDTQKDSDDLTHHRIVKVPEPDKVKVEKGTGIEEKQMANGVGISRSDPKLTDVEITPEPSGTSGWRDIGEEEDGEKPPFAPASNIELVVLPRRDKVQLTIYNSADLTLVREERNLTMKKGWNWLQFQWANTKIDPTSLSLEPKEKRDQIRVEQLVFPPRLKDLGRWLIRSKVSGQAPFEITYLTSGLSWRAFYMGTLTPDEKTMRLQGYVRAANRSGDDYEDAQTRLIVGKVHLLDTIADLAKREHPFGRPGIGPVDHSGRVGQWADMDGDDKLTTRNAPRSFYSYAEMDKLGELRKKEVVKEGLSEYFLYTIEGTETIPNGYAKRLPSFEEDAVPVVNLYKYEQERYGNNVVRFLSFENNEEHELGETPIPGGVLKVYRTADAEGYLSYAGQSEFKYIPVNEEVELNLGAVENVVAEPKLMEYQTSNYRFDHKGNIFGWDERRRFRIRVKNTRNVPVKVEIKRNFKTNYWHIANAGDFGAYEKYDKDTVQYTLSLEPQTKKQFTYTLTTYHGVRQEVRNMNGWSETTETQWRNPYPGFFGTGNMVVARQIEGQNTLKWKTAVVPPDIAASATHRFRWAAGMGRVEGPEGKFTLMLGDKELVDFHAVYQDAHWSSPDGNIHLSYQQHKEAPEGSSGIMELRLPASLLTPGEKAELRVVGSDVGNIRWFGVYEIN